MFQPGRNLSILPESCPTCQTLSQHQHTQPGSGLLPWLVRRPRALSGNGRPTHPRPARCSARRFPKRIAIRLGLVSNRFVDPPKKPIFLPPTFAFDPSHPRAPFVPLHSCTPHPAVLPESPSPHGHTPITGVGARSQSRLAPPTPK